MINNGMSWLSLGNYINPKARNTELSNDYNQLTNRPIITLTGTSQNPIKLWKLDVGLYILNGYVQHTDALLSEARGLFVSATVGIVNGKYVISAFIPFWEGQYEYILPSLSSETYTEHQMIRMITQGNSLTLDNIREYFPTQDYHPTTKKYVDETMDAIRNELGKMGLNNNDVQSLIKENRRRDIAIQALLSQNSDKMVTINEEVHDISMDYSLDEGIATINTLEGDTLVNVSKDTEYDKVLSYEQDIVENTNTVDLEADGNLNPIIVGDTLVNVCTQNNPTAITNEYTVEGSNHFALQDEAEGNCRPIIQGNTIVNRSKTKDSTPLTTYVSEVEGNEMSLVDDTDTHVRVDKLVGDTMVNLAKDITFANTAGSYKGAIPEKVIDKEQNAFYITSNAESSLVAYYDTVYKLKSETTYTIMCEVQTNINNNHNEEYTIAISYKGVKAEDSTTVFAFVSSSAMSKFNEDFSDFVKLTTTITTPSESVGVANGVTVGNHSTSSAFIGAYLNIKNLVVLEGDYTNKPIPQEYFEGIKSSYEDKCIPKNLVNNIAEILPSDEKSMTRRFSKSLTDFTVINLGDKKVRYSIYDNNGVWIEDKSITSSVQHITLNEGKYSTLIAAFLDNSNYPDFSYGSLENFSNAKILVLEGDYTSNPPTYEEVMEHSGQYRCKVEVQGENYNQTQTVYLNSPLLKGDEVVYKEGKLCHYHKMGKVVLDGSEDESWTRLVGSDGRKLYRLDNLTPKLKKGILTSKSTKLMCDRLQYVVQKDIGIYYDREISAYEFILVYIADAQNDNFTQWLSENPTTVVYELANPYYETISTSELLLPITTNCKLLTSSNIPLTTMSTRVFTEEVNILANTQYSLNFNSDVASTVNITLGETVLSNQAIVKGYNKFSITTPSTLVDNNLLIIEGSGVNISEVVVTEYDEGICEYIEGLKSSFEDGYIPSEDLILDSWFYGNQNVNVIRDGDYAIATQSGNSTEGNIVVRIPTICKANTLYTLVSLDGMKGCIIRDDKNGQNLHQISPTDKVIYATTDKVIYATTFQTKQKLDVIHFYYYKIKVNDTVKVSNNFMILEGDWTHLTKEDFNHLGQYKVEYKVVGKNKLNPQNFSFDNKSNTPYLYENNQLILEAHNSIVWGQVFAKIQLKPNTDYILSTKSIVDTEKGGYALIVARKADDNALNPPATESASYTIFKTDETGLTRIKFYCTAGSTSGINMGKVTYTNIQLEEGTIATEYEPYKESTQTVYLNSPLLEGDTIEEIDGEVYHVHRYGKVVLDGSENWKKYGDSAEKTTRFYIQYPSVIDEPYRTMTNFISSTLPITKIIASDIEGINIYTGNDTKVGNIRVRLNNQKLSTTNENGFKQWLSENPTTIVYELVNPTYELIPSSSIVCKSYSNGHLDFDTNVHIDNTVNFVKANLPITYANTSTNYKLQFVSDKDMENVTINVLGNIMENVTITKGLNKISFTSPSDVTNILTFEGIGYAYISDVQLVATEKDIDYFKGLYSTYECGLIEDESNENYGKYEVNIVSYNAPIQFGKGGKIE